jgi:hypothetical protein
VPQSSTLVEPRYLTVPEHSKTLGPEVADLADLAGFSPDPEQRLALDAVFAMQPDDRAAAFEVAVIACRQNLKTGLFKQAALGWLFLTGQRLIVWSAHEFPTAVEAFRDLSELIEGRDWLTRRLKRIYRGNGDESIELMSGARLIFRARTKGGGRGLSGDKVILDEAFALQPVHMGALLPTLSARPDPQVLYGSSAGLADSEVLRGVRDRGRKSLGRLAYVEWTAEGAECAQRDCSHVYGQAEGCALDDMDNWHRANPQLGGRIRVETVEAERQALPWQEFARERLGWWDDPGVVAPAFGAGVWEALKIPDGSRPKAGAIGIAVSFDRAWGSIGSAGRLPDGRVLIGAVKRRQGTSWLVSEAARIQRDHGCQVVVDEKGPAGPLLDELRDAGVELTVVGVNAACDACADVYDAAQDARVAHMGDDDLDAAVMGATARPVGDRWMWGRKTSLSDVSMLEAATLAHWAVTKIDDPDGGWAVAL